MAQINVTQFAKELGLPIELLVEQLQTAGVNKKLAEDTVLTEKDKTQLLDYLRDTSDTVRIAAATALEALAMTPEGKAALTQHVTAVEAMLNDVVERVRLAGVRILAALDAQRHLPLLVRALTDSSRGIRSAKSK